MHPAQLGVALRKRLCSLAPAFSPAPFALLRGLIWLLLVTEGAQEASLTGEQLTSKTPFDSLVPQSSHCCCWNNLIKCLIKGNASISFGKVNALNAIVHFT